MWGFYICHVLNKSKNIYDLNEAREKIRRFCAYQERSQKQVEEKLRSYGLKPLAADELLIELLQENYLNETRFASAFARGKFNIKGWGRRKIEQELWRHGVSKPNIAAALAEIEDENYTEKLKSIAQKKYNSLTDRLTKTRQQKTTRYLMGRGYLWDEIQPILDEIQSS